MTGERKECGGPGFRALAPTAALLLVTALAPDPATAQAADTVPADTVPAADRPFVEGGVYDKPYLTRLQGRTALGGYAEAHARWTRAEGITEEAGFLLKRWNLFTSTRVSDFVRFGAELEVEDGGEEIILEYAAVDLALHPSVSLRAGAILAPLGRFNLSHDSPLNPFTDRPLVSTEILGVALTEPGVGLFGTIPLAGTGRLTYEAYAVNGFDDRILSDATEGTRIPLGEQAAEDNNDSPSFVGRVAWSPAVGHEIGVSGHRGRYNAFRIDGEEVEEPRDLTIFVVDFETTVEAVTVAGEAALAEVDVPPSLAGIFASSQRGLFVEVVRPFGEGWIPTMPGSLFEAKARLDAVDFDADTPGDGVRQISVGVNLRPTPDTALKLEWVRGTERDAFDNPASFGGLLFSLATYF